ncbi:MAG: DnaA regulatory inactivator Hda [Pseudomonadota bacterium]|nr:DnaA regulatory inactivator Hda [Pseudomonadota bacterium]
MSGSAEVRNNEPSQLTLQVALRDDARFANYYPGVNQQVRDALQGQWTTAGEPFIYLWGATGSGVSHLLQAACHYAEGIGHQSMYLPLAELKDIGPGMLEGVDQLPLVAIDDLQEVMGDAEWEEALFHLYNRIRDRQSHLLIGASAPPSQAGGKLPDLVSRLSWGITYQVETLSDEEKVQALILRARQRGFDLLDDVAVFIMNRGPRDMAGLCQILDQLDQASLKEKRKLTIPFVKSELGW